ncbi:MAG: CDP-alcohol phosphatidyltransferase family protein [Candidatus Eisenbacteria bacterium]
MSDTRGPGLPGEAGMTHHDEIPTLKERLRSGAHAMLDPLVSALAGVGVRPDHLTVAGTGLSVVASIAFFEGGFRLAALILALAGVCDILDGQLARRQGVPSRFGAFLDSTLDRLSDGVVLAGIAGYYMAHLLDLVIDPRQAVSEISRGLEPRTWAVVSLTAIAGLILSYMVSYTRARAEGLGLTCRVGWFERPERMLLLIVAALFGVGPYMPAALLILAILSLVTAIQRVTHVWKITRGAGMDR